MKGSDTDETSYKHRKNRSNYNWYRYDAETMKKPHEILLIYHGMESILFIDWSRSTYKDFIEDTF